FAQAVQVRLALLQRLANHASVALIAFHAVVHIEVAQALLGSQAQLVQAEQIIGRGCAEQGREEKRKEKYEQSAQGEVKRTAARHWRLRVAHHGARFVVVLLPDGPVPPEGETTVPRASPFGSAL